MDNVCCSQFDSNFLSTDKRNMTYIRLRMCNKMVISLPVAEIIALAVQVEGEKIFILT